MYLGIHLTNDPEIFDGYLGSGVYVNQASTFKYPKTPFQCAVKKYGADSFRRYTLYVCDSLEEALAKKYLFGTDFFKQSHIYNTVEVPATKIHKLYQFNESGELVKTWECDQLITDFYGYPYERFQWAAGNKLQFLGYYWSYSSEINPSEYTRLKGNFKVYYLYNLQGKLLRECYCKDDLEYWGGIHSEIEDIIKFQIPINDYYLSNKLMDVFVPRAKSTYSKRTYYVYTKDNGFKGVYRGKEILRVLDTYSWKNIKKAIEINKGWYKDFYISFAKVDKVPEKVFKMQIDVYDHFGNFIESLNSIKEVREKYKLTSAQLKNIQLGDKYISNWIFKYHSK